MFVSVNILGSMWINNCLDQNYCFNQHQYRSILLFNYYKNGGRSHRLADTSQTAYKNWSGELMRII